MNTISETGCNHEECQPIRREGLLQDAHHCTPTSSDITSSPNIEDAIFSQSMLNILPKEYRDQIKNSTPCHMIKNITIRTTQPLTLSYLPKGKTSEVSEGGTWSRKGRQETNKVGKTLQQVYTAFGLNLKPDALRSIVDKLKVTLSTDVLKVVTGDELVRCYLGDNYRSGCGSLNDSCMQGGNCSDFMKFYTENNVEMIVSLESSSDLVTGRALLWSTNKGKVMDRIYGTDAKILEFIEYAKENGYWYKTRQSFEHDVDFQKGNLTSTDFTVETVDYDGLYPYCDSFKFLGVEDNILSTTKFSKEHSYRLLESTSGGYTEYLMVKCAFTGKWNPRDNCSIVTRGRLEGLYVDDMYLRRTWHDGKTILKEDAVSLYNGKAAHKDDAILLKSGNYALTDYTIVLYNGDITLKNAARQLHDGRWAATDSVVQLPDGSYALKEEVGRLYLESISTTA